MKKKLSSKVLMSFVLSAVLFCMPVGAFMMNSGNIVPAFASDGGNTEENTSESATEETTEGSTEGSTEQPTEESTEESTEAPAPVCICEGKCSQYDITQKCEVCKADYTQCAYVNPNVKVTIKTPSGWHNDATKVHVTVEDVADSGNFTIKTVEAKIAQNGSWTDITEDMYVEISENSTIYIRVTDQKGETYEKNRYIKCFDFTKPTLNAAVSDGLLSVQAHDTDSGVQKVYVNGYEFTELTNGTLSIRLQQFDSGYQNFTIQAMDNAGNLSDVYKAANPYYTDQEAEDSTTTENPAAQLPVSSQATPPSSATAQVTEHTQTDSNGNTVSSTRSSSSENTTDSTGGTADGDTTSETGKEFYTIQTASEKVFYLIIDRDGDEEMVYFLTEISENDLLNTTTTSNSETLPKNSAALESAIPTSDGALSNNNGDTNVSGATSDSLSENGTEEATEGTETPEDTEAEETPVAEDSTTLYIILGIAAVAVIGGAYYLKVVRKKKEDFLDEDDDEDEEEETYEEDEDAGESEDDFFTDEEEENV